MSSTTATDGSRSGLRSASSATRRSPRTRWDAFLAVWRTAGRFVPERALARTWLLTIVHRRAVDLVRREERRRTEPIEDAPEQAGADTAESAWLGFERERIRGALSQLPDQQREALGRLAYYGGFHAVPARRRLGEPVGYDQEQDVQRPGAAA